MPQTSKSKFRITGRVIDRKTQRGVPGLRVEAWDKDLIFHDLVGSAVTDAQGAFRIEFDESYFKEIFLDRQPDLFFKVFREDKLLKSTEDSVLWNVPAGETEITIEVDMVSNGEPALFIVRGQIRHQDGSLLKGLTARAFDKDLRSEELLGEAVTNDKGWYQIAYAADQFSRAEKKSADLIVRVLSPEGLLLAASAILFNAPRESQIDIVVVPKEQPQLSEYEQLLAQLAPILQNLPLAELTDDDIGFLVGETGLDRQRIEFLAQAARLARETDLPTEVFYGFARQGLPLELEALLVKDPTELRNALASAIDSNIIPARLRDSLDAIMERLEQLRLERGTVVSYTFFGQLLDQETSAPLSGYTVSAFDLDAGPEPKELGFDITNATGLFTVIYTAPRLEVPDEAGENVPVRRLRLHIIDPKGVEIHQTEVQAKIGDAQVVEIRVPVPEVPEPPSPSLQELNTILQLQLPPELLAHLANQGIQTLSDIRKAGGISRIEGLPVPADHPAVQTLEAHASLSSLSADVQLNHKLIGQGVTSASAIANVPRTDFVGLAHTDLGDFKAAQIQVMAQAQTQFLSNVVAGLRADRANGFGSPIRDFEIEDVSDVFVPQCSCKDCEAAVSPTAYLADLLDYALRHLKIRTIPTNGVNLVPITLDFLEDNFHQPFGDLPTACEALTQQVRQVRICIEVLRSFLGARPLSDANREAALARSENEYRMAVYTTLLNRIGTSYEEIRLARTADEETRQALADRLGIPLDRLDGLFLEPTAVTEQALERLFGLADTTRDPLSEGAKRGDPEGQITRWNLDGAEWNRNTDRDGRVYVSLKNPEADVFRVELYRDQARAELVASGQRAISIGTVKLTAENGSGLSGSFDIQYSMDTETVEIAVIPEFLSWRLAYLRTLWKEQDWPADPYSEDAEHRLPIIDPDVIGPDDLRHPMAGHPAFDLWQARRSGISGIDAILADLKASREANGLEHILKQVLGDPLPDLAALLTNLKQGTQLEETVNAITALNLTIESFTRLMEVKGKDDRDEPVREAEWGEVYAILAQAEKVKKFPDWITEEEAIILGPKLFWISLREPEVGNWPPVQSADRPLIDPDIIEPNELPEPTAGQRAIELWKARRSELDQIYDDLRVQYETNGFDELLSLALGHPNPGDPLQHNLTILNDGLKSSDPVVVEDAKGKITNDLYLTIEDFTRLMVIKAKDEAPAPGKKPTAEELSEAYRILTTARKEKHELGRWISEEQDSGIVYWNALKAKLPRWRATIEVRQVWQQALRTHSQPPLIDPDLIGPAYLKDPFAGDAADRWQERRDFIDKQLTDIRSARELEAIPLDGLNVILGNTLGMSADDLKALANQRDQGTDITANLDQLGLPNDAFAYLVRVRDLLLSSPPAEDPLLASEWEDVYSILTQVLKRREFAAWREEERGQGITLSPDYFKIPNPPAFEFPPREPEPIPAWRATEAALRSWRDKLQSRIELEKSVIEALQAAVSATEEATLPMLRDALIEATNVAGIGLEAKAKAITDQLLIDAKAGGCQITTRISQAIETIQILLWSVRTGQLIDTHPQLLLDADDFDEEWKWLGAYNTWRAAMFVFLYPENILLPHLRKWQTPAFKKLVRDLRANPRLTPEQACAAARTYSDYFHDVCTLSLEASCQTLTRVHSGEGCRDRTAAGYLNLFYMFARGGATDTVYWSAYDAKDDTGYAQTFWEAVPGLENVTVVKILGAVPYKTINEERFIYLFAKTLEKGIQKLVFTKYDLESQTWDNEPTPLDPPNDATTFSAAVEQRNDESAPPHLVISVNDGKIYSRRLKADGSDWEDDDFLLIIPHTVRD